MVIVLYVHLCIVFLFILHHYINILVLTPYFLFLSTFYTFVYFVIFCAVYRIYRICTVIYSKSTEEHIGIYQYHSNLVVKLESEFYECEILTHTIAYS